MSDATSTDATVGSLFSGCLGLDLGLEQAGWRTAWACENDEACTRVINRRRPGLPVYPDVRDTDLHARFAEDLYADTGLDLRGATFGRFYEGDVVGAASLEVVGDHLEITTWREGGEQRVIEKH